MYEARLLKLGLEIMFLIDETVCHLNRTDLRRMFEEIVDKLQRFEKIDSAKRFARWAGNEGLRGLELRPGVWCVYVGEGTVLRGEALQSSG